MKLTHLRLLSAVTTMSMLASCAQTPPLATLLPPASKPRLAVVPDKASYRENGIAYTDAGLQAGNAYGIAGMLIGAAMRSVTLSHNAAFSKVWKTSGKNAANIVLDEFRQELARNGYTLDDAAADKLHIRPGTGMITCDRPNAPASQKKYFALCQPGIVSEIGGRRRMMLAGQGMSESAFTYETVTLDSYEAALREAGRLAARRVIHGMDLKTGKPLR